MSYDGGVRLVWKNGLKVFMNGSYDGEKCLYK